eukprot:3278517-Rhodomonas_salina.1
MPASVPVHAHVHVHTATLVQVLCLREQLRASCLSEHSLRTKAFNVCVPHDRRQPMPVAPKVSDKLMPREREGGKRGKAKEGGKEG